MRDLESAGDRMKSHPPLSTTSAFQMRRLDFPRVYLVLATGLALALSIFLLVTRSERLSSWQAFPESGQRYSIASTSGSHSSASLDTILNETLGFQKILVINMKTRSDHRDQSSLAAALTGLKLEYVDGVTEFDSNHAIPVRPEVLKDQGPKGGGFDPKVYLSWRAHMNAVRKVVEEGLTSALILEDDCDYDVRIKSQAQMFAKASRLLLQPTSETGQSLDPTNPRVSREYEPTDIHIDDPTPMVEPTTSPYGDIDLWDVLWMGHCGTGIPGDKAYKHPSGRVVFPNDETVVETQQYDPGYGDRHLWTLYPNHTRIYMHARTPVCNLAYGLSLPGAKRLLWQGAVSNMTGTTDTIIRQVCDGDYPYKKQTCLSVLPTLFQHHRPKAYPRPYTENIRYGTRANFEALIDGTDLVDAFPDGEDQVLYFHHGRGKERWEEYVKDPWKVRTQEQKARGTYKNGVIPPEEVLVMPWDV